MTLYFWAPPNSPSKPPFLEALYSPLQIVGPTIFLLFLSSLSPADQPPIRTTRPPDVVEAPPPPRSRHPRPAHRRGSPPPRRWRVAAARTPWTRTLGSCCGAPSSRAWAQYPELAGLGAVTKTHPLGRDGRMRVWLPTASASVTACKFAPVRERGGVLVDRHPTSPPRPPWQMMR
jgi:hypothetical protein